MRFSTRKSVLRTGPGNPARASSDESGVTTPSRVPEFSKQDVRNTREFDTSPPPFITARTFIMAILAAMGGFIFGYDTGQISGFLVMQVFLQRFGEQDTNGTYYFSNVRSGLIVGLLSIGTLIGCLVTAPLSNRFGRRTCMPFWCIVFAIGITIQIAVGSGGYNWVGIVLGRWVAGLGVGGLSVLVPLYLSESTPKQVRGAVVCSYQLFITIGIFTADAINYGTEALDDTKSYRIPMGIGYVWALVLGVGICFMPESPRWDIRNGNHDRAFNTMTKLAGVSRHHRLIHAETKEINKALEASQGKHPWWEVFTAPKMFYRTTLAMVLQSLQQGSGANFFFYYGTTIFTGVGIGNSYITAMILGGVNVGSTFLGLYMVEKFGRRRCLCFGALWMFVCFMVFASVGHFQYKPAPELSQQAKTSGTIMIVFACLFILAFASTWGPQVWTVIGEMFPYRYRATSMAFATASNWFWNFMLAFFTPFITSAIDYQYGYVFAGCNLAAAVIVYFFLIESAGKTLEEVDTMYLAGVLPRKSSKWSSDDIGELLVSDHMFFEKGARNIRKRNEAERGGAVQDEGAFDDRERYAGVTVVDPSTHPVESMGAMA